MPRTDWQGVTQKVLDYSAASAYRRSLLLDLPMPVVTTAGVWEESAELSLMLSPVHLFFTEHSERHVLASWSASLGIEKTRRDYLGRWAIGSHGSNDYVQCARLAVLGVRKEICETISLGTSKVDEYDLADSLRVFLKKREMGEESISEAISRLSIGSADQPWFGLDQDWPLRPRSEMQEDPVLVEPEDAAMIIPPLLAEPAEKKSRTQSDGAPFWVSLTRKRRFRRLHRKNGCWLDPKVDCWDYEQVETLEGLTVDAKCINCFGKPGESSAQRSKAEEDPGEQHSAEESSSSEEETGESGGHQQIVGEIAKGTNEVIALDEL
jgi:hypothetical protein